MSGAGVGAAVVEAWGRVKGHLGGSLFERSCPPRDCGYRGLLF